jgi:hypothetical protein
MTPHPVHAFLIRIFGSRSRGPLFITCLSNEKGGGRRHPKCVTRLCDVTERFIEKHDQPGFAIYFCVSTLKPGRTWRNKQNISELVCLHADVDLKSIDASPAKVKRVLASLPLPPQLVVFSGHGYHCYWVLTKALPADEQNIARVEAALRKLADVLAADKQVCHVAALMRLPGSHNTKHGEWTEVRTITKRAGSYSLERLEKWLNRATPLLQRRVSEKKHNKAPSSAYGQEITGKGPVNVEQRLAEMQFEGAGDSAIHPTQLSVTASLLSRGWEIQDVVGKVLEATRRVPRTNHFDWRQEERMLWAMCKNWLKKHPCPLFYGDEEVVTLGGNDAHC